MSKRRKFSAEFKRGAVEQASQPGVSCAQVARELGIRDTLPVSYTHLEVYKRQGWNRWWLQRSTRVMRTGALANARVAHSPAKPPPMTST